MKGRPVSRIRGGAWILILGGLLAALPLFAPRAEEPEYPHGDFEDDCDLCHAPGSWTPAVVSPKFKHARGGFPLLGSHATAACRACHRSLEFTGTDRECVACHLDVHTGEFGTDCGRCHTPRNFIDRTAMVRGHLATRFPLVGAHRAADCEQCHRLAPQGRMQFVNTSTECRDCHLADYQAALNPDHQASGFSTDCGTCHGTTAWTGTRGGFQHNSAAFPLTGAHATAQCSDCHSGGYAGTPSDCFSCHQADYQGTTNPDHQALGFSTDCSLCHDTTTFLNGDFPDHDAQFFPIYSGAHRGRWTTCQDCHVNPGNYAAFECILCHQHDDQARVDGDHSGVSGYQYNSQACYNCHPQGRH